MASRQPIFGVVSEHGDENEKLVELFRNRAELKKEFAALSKERFRLQQLIKEQQGATARITQRLEHLEGLLVDPEWVNTVVVFYQLRSLNRRCAGKLARFAEQLKQQREKRLRDAQLSAWRDRCNARRQGVDQELSALRQQLRQLEGQVQAERQRTESMSGLSKLFKGRSASGQLSELEAKLDALREKERALLEKVEALENAPPPDPPGLSLAEKRSINFMILAFAQQLFLQFSDRNLVALVKESGDKSVGAINYGSKRDCDVLLECIAAHVDAMEKASDYADLLKRRAELIAEHAIFKDDEEAVPVAGTVATVFAINGNGVVTKSDADLLGDNYWGIATVMSR
jgi:predicted  nucleic acid-binding Zn-ribbon protein